MSATGWTVPTSLFAIITLMRIVSGVMAASTAAGSTMPYPSTGRYVTAKPCSSSHSQVWVIAWCSTADVMMWFPFPRCANATPLSAQLSDSVPPLVKKISSGSAPIAAATCVRARPTASRAVFATS